ncbi:putative serine/threonine protein kinase [Actinacidiphila reveromycinica]|uniref:non-specific serine/threonine protein kinase n=1 Tax=Actinacidiphila reveromycinica TaxID=659352 RepID=A0A7U3UU85_9ACTN|nr:serine/threonine-protein kinase [Streptomyces sp. SN-593]BBA98731.1 putative serine/threonine protein kinase [Streptomyces sp. SN-593]
MGEVFAGRYELVDPIGHGGVGAVWRAWDRRRRRYVAAKLLQQSDAHALLRFVREQALRIDHPHVLAPASWAADDDKVLFTMDLVCGGSLSHLVAEYGPLPPHLVCVLLDQLLAGLSAVHAEGVVHRDIKPANVLLEATGTRSPHIRLSDFGIAMRKGDARLTETNYVVGTPGYFAPEQLLGAEPDFAADLYATGLVALYLLGGRKPDAQAVQDRFLEMGMPPAPVGVPGPLWQVVGTLLQPDPYARFRTATGARKALAAAMELLPGAAPDEEPVEIFDQIGPLPPGFGPQGPTAAARAAAGPEPAAPYGPPADPVPVPPRPALPPDGSQAGPHPTPPAGHPAGYGPLPHPAAMNGLAAQGVPARPTSAPTPTPTPPAPPAAAPDPSPPPLRMPSAPPSPAPYAPPGEPVSGPQPPGGRRQARHAAPTAHAAPEAAPAPAAAPGLPPEPPTHPPTRADHRALPLPEPAPYAGPAPSAATPSGPAATPSTPDPDASADTASTGVPARRAKPGPPAKVAVPVLVLALLCFAVGVAALMAS